MKKYLLLIILLLPISVLAEIYTITYDANDGSGRTKVVEYSDVQNIVLEGTHAFEKLDDNANDPMDDSSIDRWNLNTDNSDWGYAPWGYYETSSMFSSSNNITLYAKWVGRVELNRTLNYLYLNGENITSDINNGLNIKKYDDYKVQMSFNEKSSNNGDYSYNQFFEYHYMKMPDWFNNMLTEDIAQSYSERREIPFNLSGSMIYQGNTVSLTGKTYYGYYYIKDGYLYVDLPRANTVEAHVVDAVGNATFSLIYQVNWEVKYNNGVEYHSARLSGSVVIEELKETGVVTAKYVDIDTNEEISENVSTRDFVGEQVSTSAKDIDDYTLVEIPEEETFYYEIEEKTVYYKYKKNGSQESSNNNKKTVKGESEIKENPKTGVYTHTALTILMIASFIYIYKKIKTKELFKI